MISLYSSSRSRDSIQFALANLPPQLSDKVSGIEIVSYQVGVPVGPDEVEGETYYCGTFPVPLDWNNPDRGSLDLGFIVIKATGENPEPDPLIYLAGGPGQSALATPALAYEKLRPKHDILRLDQRGVGISQRLNYEECLVLAAQTGATDSKIEILLAAINPPFFIVLTLSEFSNCFDQQQGPDQVISTRSFGTRLLEILNEVYV